MGVAGAGQIFRGAAELHQHRRFVDEFARAEANDVHAEPGYERTPETADVHAELVVPLVVDGDVWGALNIEEVTRDAFDHDDVILLSTLANQVAAALRAARLLERLQAARG